MAATVAIKLAPGMRRYLRAYFLVVILVAGGMGVGAFTDGRWGVALVAGTAVALVGIVGWRWSSLAVTAEEDCLIVRQFLKTRRINRGEIVSFEVGGRRRETPGVAVRAVLHDGRSVVLSATGWYFRSREDVETLRRMLAIWHRPTSLGPSDSATVSSAP